MLFLLPFLNFFFYLDLLYLHKQKSNQKQNPMKKFLLLLAVLPLFIANSYSQASFGTGALTVEVDEYGGIALLSADDVYQLYRAAILVGSAPDAVFDYKTDADVQDPTILVTNPTSSDFEIYGAYNNAYSGLPPDVIVKLNAYGWNNGEYTVVKFNIQNTASTAIDALAGLDIIPYLNEEYGFDSVSYNSTAGVIRFHRGAQVNMGMKLLSATMTSLYSFEWYDAYEADTSYWNWMTTGELQPLYASPTADGPVTITSQGPVALAAGQTFNVYYALALGANEQAMLANISSAVVKYQTLITSVDNIKPSANAFNLGQNYPNPFKNSTEISYQLPDDGFVSLKVYDVMGNEVAALVNSTQTKGSHSIHYNANGLSSGVYYYTIRLNDQVKTNKMFVIK